MEHFNTRSTLLSRSQQTLQKLLKAGAAAMLLLGPTAAFSQVCGPINTFPYTENFDAVTAPDLPCGWDTLNVNADNRKWSNESLNPNSAPNAMVYRYSIPNAADDWFFSRAFTLDASKLYVVTFNYRMQSAAYPEKLEVRWGTSAAPAGMPVSNTVWIDTQLVNTTYQLATANGFTPSATGTYYLGFHAFSDPDMWNIFIDDITVTEIGPCTGTPVTGTISTTNTVLCGGSSATLTAPSATQATGITYQWQESNDDGVNDPWTNAVGGSGSTTATYVTPAVNASIYYRLVINCSLSGQSATSGSIALSTTGVPCYCNTNLHSGNCSAGDAIDIVEIAGTTLLNSGSGCGGVTAPAYTLYPASGSTTATLQPGTTYTFNITTTSNNILSIWIDFNRDGVFDASEHTQVSTTSASGVVNTAQVSIPVTAQVGITGMRIRSRASGSPNGPTDACTQFFSGETEDYFVQIGVPVPCAGTPAGGTISIDQPSTCLNSTAILTSNGVASGVVGLVYEWQESDDNGVNDPWTIVSGGSNPNQITYTTAPLLGQKWFRLSVTCTNSSQTSFSTSGQVTVSNVPCYCIANLHASNCSANDHIESVSINNTVLNNLSAGCNGTAALPGYSNSATNAILNWNNTYTITVTSSSNSSIEVWIDFDRDGVFDPNLTEWKLVTPASTPGTPVSTTFTVPATAQLGQTGMRIRSINAADFSQATPASACNQFNSGETEDYVITIDSQIGLAEEVSAAVSVVPNPTSGNVTLQLPAALTNGTVIRVYDANGREVYQTAATGGLTQELNLTGLADGLYVLQTTLNEKIIVKRIAVQK